jgi:farnesyl diphosphate synthase
MAGGQAIDCHHVGQSLSVQNMQTMHSLKTGALLHASVMMGAMCAADGTAHLSAEQLVHLSGYADDLGLLFQVVDDVLDASQDTATLGKTAGKDAEANKPTYVQAMGIEGARAFAQKLYSSALSHLSGIASAQQQQGVQYLADLASYCHERIY